VVVGSFVVVGILVVFICCLGCVSVDHTHLDVVRKCVESCTK